MKDVPFGPRKLGVEGRDNGWSGKSYRNIEFHVACMWVDPCRQSTVNRKTFVQLVKEREGDKLRIRVKCLTLTFHVQRRASSSRVYRHVCSTCPRLESVIMRETEGSKT